MKILLTGFPPESHEAEARKRLEDLGHSVSILTDVGEAIDAFEHGLRMDKVFIYQRTNRLYKRKKKTLWNMNSIWFCDSLRTIPDNGSGCGKRTYLRIKTVVVLEGVSFHLAHVAQHAGAE